MKLFILHTWSGQTCGVYSSKEHLHEAVSYWIEYLSKYEEDELILTYEEWDLDYIQEPNSWDWAHISSKCNFEDLCGGGRTIPYREWLGKNLVNQEWEGMDT